MGVPIHFMKLFSEFFWCFGGIFADALLRAGVPHVVLPVWYDTYDFATRVEWLGIGVWGNKTVAPRVDGAELGAALVRAITSTDAIQLFLKAQDISEKLGEGRVIACEKIIELLSADEKDDDDELMENGD